MNDFNLHILDCTLRDGGYQNDWQFCNDEANSYLSACLNSGISLIEIGFRLKNYRNKNKHFAFITSEYLESISENYLCDFAVMYNLNDFRFDKDSTGNTEKLLGNIIYSDNMVLARIACNFDELHLVPELAKVLHSAKCSFALNLMKIDHLTDEQISSFVNIGNDIGCNIMYFADSFGGLSVSRCAQICEIFSDLSTAPFGIHAHDNMGLALINSITAFNHGASYIDGTILGMGRGAGNTRTEELISYFKDIRDNTMSNDAIMQHAVEWLIPRAGLTKWGKNPFYYKAAELSIHPTYIQKICEIGLPLESLVSVSSVLEELVGVSKYDANLWKKIERKLYGC